MPPVPDRDVVAESLTRPEAFAELFERHSRVVHAYLSRRVGNLAEDLLSEVFLTAFAKRASYRPETPDVRPWLFGIAANLVRRQSRAEVTRYRALARAGSPPEPDTDWDGVHERLDATELRPLLAATLATLEARDREVLLLVAWGDLTYSEVAVALGIPLGTVRSRLHRARRRLRADLDHLSPHLDHLSGDLR